LTSKQDSFEQYRPYLMGLAYRLLGSRADAEDAVQDTWLRWQSCVRPNNDKAWLTRVCTNICIDVLRRLKRERARYDGPWLPDPVPSAEGKTHLTEGGQGELADSLQLAYILLLERLTARERASLLLHDVFGFSFDEVASILAINTCTARQIASRARRHLKNSKTRFSVPEKEIQTLGSKLQAAVADGDLNGIISHLARDVELWSDGGGKALAARNVIAGAGSVAAFLAGIFRKAAGDSSWKTGTVNGKPALFLYGANRALITLLTLTSDANGQVDRLLIHRNPDKLSRATENFLIV